MDGSNAASFQRLKGKDDENDSCNDEEGNNDSPYLLSNLEVFEILQPRVKHRHGATGVAKLASTNERAMKKRQKILRHRNWIEDEVVQYIQHTATMEFHSTKNSLPLHSILRRRKRRSPPDDTPVLSSASETTAPTAISSALNDDVTKKRLTMGFHLTEAEVIQILNHSPKEMVDLHLYIDQIHDRFTISDQEEILRIIDHFRTIQPVPAPTNGATNGTRHSQELGGSNLHFTSMNDTSSCNGVETNGECSSNRSTLNHTNTLPPDSEEYEYHDDPRAPSATTTTTTTALSNTVTPPVFTNHVKIEIIERDDRKPAAI